MRLASFIVVLALSSLALVGCTRTDQFDITVRNETTGPVTIALTKDGPPFEQVWAKPEDLAIESPRADEKHGFAVLAPGKEADVSVTGKFDSNTRGYVRIYRGDLRLSDMIAMSPTSPNRIDLLLRPGVNRLTVGEEGGRLIEKTSAATTQPAR
jgi:hypothetical protein